MNINLNKRTFKSQSNSANGEVSEETLFQYQQDGEIISAHYEGGDILKGHLIGNWIDGTSFEFVYHHINTKGELMTGKCQSFPSIDEQGKLKLLEYWQWTCRDHSKGKSVLIEV